MAVESTITNPAPQSNLQTGGSDTASLMGAIIQKQLSSSGIVSSATPTLEASILAAQKGVKESNEFSNQAIESSYGRERGYMEEQGSSNIQTQLESRSGFATQMVAFRSLVQTTDKNLNDLKQRKDELIMQNNSAAAAKVADLEFKAIEFRDKAQQQVFSNLLGMANFGMQVKQEERMSKQLDFAQATEMNKIKLEYGVGGKNIEEVMRNAMPFASKQQQADLAIKLSIIRKNNADASSAIKGKDAGTLDYSNPGSLTAFASQTNQLRNSNPDYYAQLMNTVPKGQLISVSQEQGRLTNEYYSDSNLRNLLQSQSYENLSGAINTDLNLSPNERVNKLKNLDSAQKAQKAEDKKNKGGTSWFDFGGNSKTNTKIRPLKTPDYNKPPSFLNFAIPPELRQ